MKVIAVFNNKGGVGKTTFMCNLSSYLSLDLNKKVLIIDADPQCNASTYIFDQEILEKTYAEDDNKTIQAVVDPISKGEGTIAKEAIPIHHSENFGVDVIMGDTRLATSEDFLSNDWIEGKGGEYRGLKSTLMFFDLIQKLNDYDYILFDVGPSLGAINRSVLLACEYFIMPMSSDIFCLKAIDNISIKLIQWEEDIQRGIGEYKRKQGQDFKIGNKDYKFKLKFLGYINQQYKGKTVDGKVRPVKAYDQIISQIPENIKDKLAGFYPVDFDTQKLLIGEIPNYNSLIPLSQLANKPIAKLDSADGVVGAHFMKVEDFGKVISQIGNNIIQNIDSYDTLA